MKAKIVILSIIVFGIVLLNIITKQEAYYHPEFNETNTSALFRISTAYAYPPAVGILSNAKNCLVCHANNGPWKDDDKTIIDILDKETRKSFK